MPKRKAGNSEEGLSIPSNRRSTRHRPSNGDEKVAPKTAPDSHRPQNDKNPPKPSKSKAKKTETVKVEDTNAPQAPKSQHRVSKPPNGDVSQTQHYWLMKAEPESRLERGHDIKFSIDDLAAKAKPEPWDGIRAYTARNNLRAMKKGDLAFFYHSSCKVPSIVGIMEIVKEHSPDFSAQDRNAPYYDPKDLEVSNPKWSVVHVEFRRKLKEPITLKELREFAAKGGPLENMQMLKQSRLSVSGVSAEEWNYLMGIIEEREGKEKELI